MNRTELIQIIVGTLGLFGSWKLSQWWLIVVIAILILLIPVLNFFTDIMKKKKYFKILEKSRDHLKDVKTKIDDKKKDLLKKEYVDKLVETCEELSRVSSGSWLGYHSSIYYRHFQSPPKNTFFNPEWGIKGRHRDRSVGNWEEYSPIEVDENINEKLSTDNPLKENLDVKDFISSSDYISLKSKVISILTILLEHKHSNFFEDENKSIKQTHLKEQDDIISKHQPSNRTSRDSLAVAQGIQVPRHIIILSKALMLKDYEEKIQFLEEPVNKIV